MINLKSGGRDHSLKSDSVAELTRLINETYARKGKIIIPSFAVGRTQQVVFVLHQLTLEGKIPHLPIFVDSPLSVNATEVFRLHPECFNEATYRDGSYRIGVALFTASKALR